MNQLNSILVEGNLVKDPSTKTLSSGNQVCAFTLASNRNYKNSNQVYEEEVSYFDVEAWSRLGIACAQHLKKGRGVRVVGRLKQDRWLDSDGKHKTKVKIVAEHVEFKPQKKEDEKAQAIPEEVQEPETVQSLEEETEGAAVF
jgi:single-strand DNA-binding protein